MRENTRQGWKIAQQDTVSICGSDPLGPQDTARTPLRVGLPKATEAAEFMYQSPTASNGGLLLGALAPLGAADIPGVRQDPRAAEASAGQKHWVCGHLTEEGRRLCPRPQLVRPTRQESSP